MSLDPKKVKVHAARYWFVRGKRASVSARFGVLAKRFLSSRHAGKARSKGVATYYPIRSLNRRVIDRPAPRPRNNMRLGFLLVVLAGVIIFAVVKTGQNSAWDWNPSTAAAPADKLPDLSDPRYHGTDDTRFAKDWVFVDGDKIDGILAANPAPQARVAILNTAGGKDIPAHQLPQGFLDLWNITPERLQTAENR